MRRQVVVEVFLGGNQVAFVDCADGAGGIEDFGIADAGKTKGVKSLNRIFIDVELFLFEIKKDKMIAEKLHSENRLDVNGKFDRNCVKR